MSITINIPYEQIRDIVKQLPASELKLLKAEIEKEMTKKKNEDKDHLKKLLLHGPVMEEEQLDKFKEIRQRINQWRIQ